MPRFRFTIRRIMIVVVIAAVVSSVGIMRSRRIRYLERAAEYAQLEQVARAYDPDFSRATKMDRTGKVLIDVVPKNVDRYAQLRAKYERAARYPWLSVAPDPPEPQ
jgi:hypothetical protein